MRSIKIPIFVFIFSFGFTAFFQALHPMVVNRAEHVHIEKMDKEKNK